jgi:endo-1,4-beta-xylanase
MRQYVSWSVLGIVLLGCGVQSPETGEELAATQTQALQCRRGHGHGHDNDHGDDRDRPKPCSIKRDPAFALPIAACEAGLLVGSAVSEGALVSDPAYATLLSKEFSYVTPENSMKWGSLQPTSDKLWDFTEADRVVAAAKAARQSIKGHALVWHQQLPPFVTDALSKKELERAIERNIDKVVGRYRGEVRAWDVVNEALADDGTLRDSIFSRKLGADFIADAFERAHRADPRADLFYNDYGIEIANAKSDAVYELVRQLKKKRVPIDGVGFQMHIDARFPPTEAQLRENFKRFDDLGLSINVSEMDVQVRNVIGTRADKLALQKQIYHRVVAACVKTDGCEAITTWGFTDKYSWIDATFGADDPLEFDEALARKPAYYAMVDGFLGIAPDAEGVLPNLIGNASFEAGVDGWFGFGIPSVTLDSREHTGHRAGLARGRTDTWQGPGIDVSTLVQPGWVYDASAFVSIRGATTDAVRLSAKITCQGAADTFSTVAAGTANGHSYLPLAGTLSVPLCAQPQVVLYVEGPAAGVSILIDDVALRARSEPLGPNVVVNGDFEAGIAGWIAWAGTIAPSSVTHGGSGSAQVSNRTATWQGPVYNLLPAVTPGASYKIGGYARVSGAVSAPVDIVVLATCSGSDTFTQVAAATANDQGFVAMSGSYQVPACSNLTQLALYVEGPPVGVTLLVDDVTVQQRLSIPVVPVPPPPAERNVLANGDFELGASGWFGFGASVALTTASVHAGTAAGIASGRTDTWQGPAYGVPTGQGSYNVSVYAQQNSGSALTLALSAKLTCGGVDSFATIGSASAGSGTWTKLSGTLSIPAGCSATVVYVQQFGGTVFPDLYVDDLVATPVSVVNFSGNPSFESGTTGWGGFGATISQTNAFAHSGAFAGVASGRTANWQGISFSYPAGAGKYSASLYALQNSGADFPFMLSVKLSCGGVDSFPTVATATGGTGSWVQLVGSFTVPSGCSAADLYLHQNGGSVFPDLYVDDLVALPVP